MTADDINLQILSDLTRVTIVFQQILETKELSDSDNERVRFCTKIMIGCKEKFDHLQRRSKQKVENKQHQKVMDNEIFKTFNGSTIEEIKTGTRIMIGWDQLSPTIEKLVLLRPGEHMHGLIINDEGIMVSIGRKPGRKRNANG